ncbi:hypothetical protein XFF6992_310044 [Xanthomonas citri pv. fuscans]|nr:hypothetical protein XFF6992_310044 [Xanthomonas citri pv. fuscans]SOO33190.1 hypothetical protein XFF6994_2690015 [Xanthomonas citri pv. fuscans]
MSPFMGGEGGAQRRMRVRAHVAVPAARDASQTARTIRLQSATLPATAPSPNPSPAGSGA